MQLRTLLELTNTEIQVAETRRAQARTEAVATELAENADNARGRAEAIERSLRDLGGLPALVGPLLGRAAAAVKALTEQAQPFEEALLGDLALEHQLLDRSRYLRALATADKQRDVVRLADQLITAHEATVEWLTTVLAEEALGGPAALRRTPAQAAAGAAVRWMNSPVSWSTRSIDRAMDAARSTGPRLSRLLSRGAHAGDVAAKTIVASRDAALERAEQVTRDEGADSVADALRGVRGNSGVLEPDELPIADYDELNVSRAVAAVKELTEPADVRAIVAYEEANKNRQGVVSAAQARLATIAQEVALPSV
ncbi:ferritin-like domain-containing protein [Rhodococcus sp. SGAir0479]|uniref:ferritin-like domain-containing protein n=1 Tax=Rhodococcus sp. SGAir0479 TaxID=2567884 RepID=UPI0010CD0D60|nr:ferritin-like domain-containing protein [Rhodococcus sp. SGAir0479]QCQ93753.1 ferritin-like domain-containing protein [Rhodococcus sp. SGAir0479]